MASLPPAGTRDARMNPAALYREEVYTDRAAATLRVLVPVTKDGAPGQLAPDRLHGRSADPHQHGAAADQLRDRRVEPGRRRRRSMPRPRRKASRTRCASCRRCAGRPRRRSSSRRAACRISAAAGGGGKIQMPVARVEPRRPGSCPWLRTVSRAQPGLRAARPRQHPLRVGEAGGQEVGEHPHLRRQVPPARIDDVDARRRRREAAQQLARAARRARPGPR